MAEVSGNCKFCGQGLMVDVKDGDIQNADMLATQECSCTGALHDRQLKRGLEKVEMLFGEQCEELGFKPVTEEQIDVLNEAVRRVAYDEILNATYQLGYGVKAKVGHNSKGQIEVTRTNTRAYKLTTEDE